MSYQDTYEAWLASPARSPRRRRKLSPSAPTRRRRSPASSTNCPSAPPACGAPWAWACTGMNVHVIRWATQGFADVICAEGEEGKRRGVAICMDCRNHSMEFARGRR